MVSVDAGLGKRPIQAHPVPGSDQRVFLSSHQVPGGGLTVVDRSDEEPLVRSMTGTARGSQGW